jgi:ATP:corrinoid adenosyltransferase
MTAVPFLRKVAKRSLLDGSMHMCDGILVAVQYGYLDYVSCVHEESKKKPGENSLVVLLWQFN